LAPSLTVSAPTGVAATASSSTIAHVSWNATSGATGYIVYEWNGLQAVPVANVAGGTTSVDVSGQSPGATEYFYVTAYNSTSSASSGWASVVMPTPPAATAPTNLTASATSSTTRTLPWSASANGSGYAIYYWNGFQAVLLGRVSAGTTSVTIQGLSPGSTAYFAVVAYNSTSSAATNWVAMATPVSSAATAADSFFAQSTGQMWWW